MKSADVAPETDDFEPDYISTTTTIVVVGNASSSRHRRRHRQRRRRQTFHQPQTQTATRINAPADCAVRDAYEQNIGMMTPILRLRSGGNAALRLRHGGDGHRARSAGRGAAVEPRRGHFAELGSGRYREWDTGNQPGHGKHSGTARRGSAQPRCWQQPKPGTCRQRPPASENGSCIGRNFQPPRRRLRRMSWPQPGLRQCWPRAVPAALRSDVHGMPASARQRAPWRRARSAVHRIRAMCGLERYGAGDDSTTDVSWPAARRISRRNSRCAGWPMTWWRIHEAGSRCGAIWHGRRR